MALTFGEAKTKVLRHLGDVNSKRWTTAEVESDVVAAIHDCVEQYVRNGGDRFNEEVTDSPDTTTFKIDLSAYDPIEIRSVSVLQSGAYLRVPSVTKAERGTAPGGVSYEGFRTIIVKAPGTPASDAAELLTVGSSWRSLEEWVCVRAAITLSAKYGVGRGDLRELDAMWADSVLKKSSAVGSKRFPTKMSASQSGLCFAWDPVAQTVEICRRLR